MTAITCLGKSYEVHPAAELFPMMPADQLAELAEDIGDNGQQVKIIRFKPDGSILDGRNRLVGCDRAGVEPQFVDWDGDDPIAFVVSLNQRRRHLTPGQLAALGVELKRIYAEQAAARARAGAAIATGTPVPRGTGVPEVGRAAEQAAAALGGGTSARSIARAERVLNKDPQLFEKVKTGEVTPKQAEAQLRRTEQDTLIRTHRPAEGVFSVIVADPPWKFDVRADDQSHRGRITYPPMTLDEICAYDLASRADENCILWLWTTNTHLVDGSAAKVLDAWGFTGKTLYTWLKVDSEGKPRFGGGNWGRNVTEHVILAVRGKPGIDHDAAASTPTWFSSPRSSTHSEKPDVFYQLAEQLCPHPAKLELFARDYRAGWVCDGAELETTTHDVLVIEAGEIHVPPGSGVAHVEDLNELREHVAAAAPAIEDIGIIAVRSNGAGFDGLVESLVKGDLVEVKHKGARGGTARAVVAGRTNDHKLLAKVEKLDKKQQPAGFEDTPRAFPASAVLSVVSVVERHIDPLHKVYVQQIEQWARDELDPKKPVTWRDVNDCWVFLLAQPGHLKANQRPAVGVVLRAAHEKMNDPAIATGGIKPQPPARPRPAAKKRGPMVVHEEI